MEINKKKVKIFHMCESANRSPMGNMWSAIPIALLCLIVIGSGRKQGGGLEGDEVP